ncbi:YozQ family protein [Bacillus solitudinis]|uniref:YozQ family protein n=1 Tax=Bacillus solitudinis TaxID=2014074 RepID=UPI000C24B641|nr:YozQ family protein [Bacillus solitudinis]
MKQSKKGLTQHDANVVAENLHQPSDFHSSLEVEQGLAKTHEQVNDTLTEGTIDGKIDDYEGNNINLSRENYGKSNQFKKGN